MRLQTLHELYDHTYDPSNMVSSGILQHPMKKSTNTALEKCRYVRYSNLSALMHRPTEYRVIHVF